MRSIYWSYMLYGMLKYKFVLKVLISNTLNGQAQTKSIFFFGMPSSAPDTQTIRRRAPLIAAP